MGTETYGIHLAAQLFLAMSSFVAFLSGADQYGRWVPEAEVAASAYLGGSTVDFSQALFKHPEPGCM